MPGGVLRALVDGVVWWLWSSAELVFRRSSRSAKAMSLLVWVEEVGVSWLVLGCRGGVAATAARVGSRILVGNPGCVRIVLVVKWCVSGVLRMINV